MACFNPENAVGPWRYTGGDLLSLRFDAKLAEVDGELTVALVQRQLRVSQSVPVS